MKMWLYLFVFCLTRSVIAQPFGFVRQCTIADNDVNNGDNFGKGLSSSSDGSRIVVSAPYSFSGKGHVRVYSWDSLNSSYLSSSSILGKNEQDFFGYSVAMSSDGDIIVCGARGNDDSGISSGQVQVFEWAAPGKKTSVQHQLLAGSHWSH